MNKARNKSRCLGIFLFNLLNGFSLLSVGLKLGRFVIFVICDYMSFLSAGNRVIS